MIYQFTLEQLEALKTEHLLKLCNWYEISVTSKMTRDDIISSIMNTQKVYVRTHADFVSLNTDTVSVRVQRIMDSMNKEN
jgi:hypothetical protein